MNEELIAVARDIGARLFALQAGLTAVMQTHPQPEALRAALRQAEDAGMSNMLYEWEDTYLDQYRKTVRQLCDQIPRQ